MNMLILYMVQKNHADPYYRVQASFMAGVTVSPFELSDQMSEMALLAKVLF